DFRLITVSSRVIEVLGYHPLELVGRRLTDVGIFTDEHGKAIEPEWRSPFRDRPFQARDRDGHSRFFLISGLPIFSNRTGSFQGVRGTARDVTHQREAEARLRDSETRYRAVVEDQQELICRYLPDGTMTFVNQAACRFFARDRQALIGTRFVDLVPENERKGVETALRALRDGRAAGHGEFPVHGVDGEIRWLDWRARAIRAENGHLLEVQAVGRDVTRRRKAEAVSKRLASAIEALGDMFALYDDEDRLLIGNERFRKAHGHTAESSGIGLRFEEIVRQQAHSGRVPAADADPAAWIAERLARHKTPRGAFEERHGDGSWFLIQEQRLPDGTTASVGTDITALKHAQAALEASEQRHRGFAADAAHELRTPLAVMRTQLDTLNDPQARAIRDDVDTMARMVEQLLAATRLEGQQLVMKDGVDLAKICTDIAVRLAPIAVKEGRFIEVLGAEKPVLIKGNAIALDQAIRNLVENAIRYSARQTTVTIELGPGARVAVKDRGEGVPEEKRALIFERFQRADRRAGGAGLGLTIVKRAAEAHGGRISIGDADGGGAVFVLDLNAASG
ncbi:MAG: PAS domain-containing sensor histidine kinase, partial [Rhodospirillales bacterium]